MESPFLLVRQLQVSFGLLRLTVPAYALTAFLLAVYQQPRLGDSVWGWAALIFVTLGGWLVCAGWFRGARALGQAGSQTLHGLLSLAVAVLFGWFLALSYPVSAPIGKVSLAGIYSALLCLGATSLAMIPAAAYAWEVGLFAGIIATASTVPEFTVAPLWALLLTTGGALGVVVAALYRMYMARLRAEFQASSQSDLVGLLLHDFEEGTQDWLWEADPQGRLSLVSDRLATLVGQKGASLIGRRLVDVVYPQGPVSSEDEDEQAALVQAFAAGRPFRDLEVSTDAGGRLSRWRLTAKPIFGAEGVLEGWRGVGSDVSEVQRLNAVNQRMALYDAFTDLPNRHHLTTLLHDQLSPRAATGPCGLILVDLGRFRIVNESLGHEVGDAVLREAAGRLREGLRALAPVYGVVARTGGDEFGLLVSGLDGPALQTFADQLIEGSTLPYILEGYRIEAPFHGGLALAPDDGATASDLWKAATQALGESKKSGGAVRYRPELGQLGKNRVRLFGELREAMNRNEFELHYQPQLSAQGLLIGAEALVRWRHPVRGMVSPAEFIPLLEDGGLIVEVGLWILRAACREALTWPSTLRVGVNVSAIQFASQHFVDSVRSVLAETGLPPERLELEITESVMAQDAKRIVEDLGQLRGLGIAIALDDFGTGYSSLSYLRSLPLDKLKVDQSFVRVMGQDARAAAIVRTVLGLAKDLGLATTAEGVETVDQRDQLIGLGVDNLQGYLFARPLNVPDWAQFRERFKSPEPGRPWER